MQIHDGEGGTGAFRATTVIASMCTLGLVAAMSTPELVPWKYNLLYNVATSRFAAVVGVVLLLVGAAVQVTRHTRIARSVGR